jgi:hypothetical protein
MIGKTSRKQSSSGENISLLPHEMQGRISGDNIDIDRGNVGRNNRINNYTMESFCDGGAEISGPVTISADALETR